MGTFWMILGYLVLGLIALVLVFLFFPVCLLVEFKQEQFTLKLRGLGLTVSLYPGRKNTAKHSPKAEKTVEKDTEQQSPLTPAESHPKKKIALSDWVQFVSTVGGLMRMVLKLIQIRDIRIIYPIRGEDAAQTAIRYGQVHAYFGSALGVLRNFLNMRFKQVDILPDFNGDCKYQRYFYCKIQAIPFIIIIAALYALTRLKGEKLI